MSRKTTTLMVTRTPAVPNTTEVWAVRRLTPSGVLEFELACAPGDFSKAYQRYGAKLELTFGHFADELAMGIMARTCTLRYRDAPATRRTTTR